ncbi:homocysteine S-methyltransferase family protein [Methylobacterium oryzisoli]|uniref:homocysteine S-methyltransferase family protein n=1 Tax=Methylobacterium oryzisoli TaxID=3385502 RepID=UPI003892B033
MPSPADLPHPSRPFLADGGLETTLVFLEGIDLPCFAAFPLLASEDGRARLARYFAPYADLARRYRTGLMLDTPTWRANPDWGARLGMAAGDLDAINRAAVAFLAALSAEWRTGPVLLNGVVGPRGDGYHAREAMSPEAAQAYHAPQVQSLRGGGADLVSAVTMTSRDEAVGIVRAAQAAGLPVAVSFTVETDGTLPSGEALGAAITETDAATDGAPLYYMVNCAHPQHLAPALEPGAAWLDRIRGVRPNASLRSHAELDAASDLDPGDPLQLARDCAALRRTLPALCVFGGCCGTDHRHIAAICEACLSS